jgi:hypothetical protein
MAILMVPVTSVVAVLQKSLISEFLTRISHQAA